MSLPGRNLISRYQRGMTLMEVAVTAFIIAFGLLSVAAMNLQALKSSSDAYFRSKATDVAGDLADRMRANLPAVADNSIPYEVTAAVACDNPPAAICQSTDGLEAVSCSSNQMAAYDLYLVSCQDGVNTLPLGELSVTCLDDSPFSATADPCDDGSTFLIQISWLSSVTVTQDTPQGERQRILMHTVPGVPR